MAVIRRLPERLISQIAAGEVVERPASVVKELVENALDAGASTIEVVLEVGGSALVRVTDDGVGLSAEDAELAVERHATSKIVEFDDLERVATLGFRGEALAAIAAVSELELRSATRPGEGMRVVVRGGVRERAEPIAHPRGTSVDVRSLFFNVPARRKFLKRPSTELRRALEVLQGYALVNPTVRFRLEHDGRELLQLAPTGEGEEGRRARIVQLFGEALGEHLVAIPRDPIASGFVGDRETTRGRRLFTFVNGRLLRDRALLAMFYKGVRDLWHSEDFPALFLFLDVPAHEVDVNVHPQKAEVRFRDRAVLGQVGSALRRALEEARGEEAIGLRPVAEDSRPAPLAWEGLGGRGRHDQGRARAAADEVAEGWRIVAGSGGGEPGRTGAPASLAEVSYRPWQPRGAVLSGRRGEVRSLRLLGQYKGSLLLLEGPDGLYLVDQHAAHERILYERLRRALEEEGAKAQPLLTPLLLDTGPAEARLLIAAAPALERLGFEVGEWSGTSVALRAVPAGLRADEAERLLRRFADEASDDEVEDVESMRRRLLDAQAADRACKGAIRIHEPLSPEKMEALVSELFAAEQPYTCPHGRPTVLKLDDGELERRFGRRG